VKVHTETGKYIGKVRQRWTCWKSKFLVYNGDGNVVCKIKGPACPCSACGGNVDFEVRTKFSKIPRNKVGTGPLFRLYSLCTRYSRQEKKESK